MTVEKNVDSQRPASRVDVSQVDKQCDFALLMSDHSIFPQGIDTCIIALASNGLPFLRFSFELKI